MNIAIYIPVLNIGGAEKVIINLTKQFVKNPSNHYFLITDSENSLWLDQIEPAVKILNVNSHTNLFLRLKSIRKLIISNKIDVVFSHLTHANIQILLLKCLFKFKLIIVEHNITSIYLDDLKKYKFVFKGLIKLLFVKADKIVCVSKSTEDDLVEEFNIPKVKCQVIYNPFDFGVIEKMSQADLDQDIKHWIANRKVIVTVARLEIQKNHLFLIDAIKNYAKKENLALLLIGDGSQKESIRKKIEAEGLQHNIMLVGYDTNPYKYMKNSILLIHPARFEGFGLVLLEALYLGIPVVSMNFKTAYEILEDGMLGEIVSNQTELLASVDKIIKENKKAVLQEQNIEKYSLNNVASQYENLFNAVMYNIN